jgi:cytosine/adenosine deaminase-related metal-dependent hydrolase
VIEFVGANYDGDADQVIAATGRIVMPGLINSHLHVTDTLYTKGYLEEVGASHADVPQNFAALYKVLPAVRNATDPDAQVAAAHCAFAELARTGSTTVIELGYDFEIGGNAEIAITERVAKAAGQSGLRCYSGPRYRTRYYGDDDQGSVFYKDYPRGGRERFEACIEFCGTWNGKFDDRLRTMLAPGQIDTCDSQLLKDTRRYADEMKIPIQIHAGQSPNEYARVTETEGKSTIEYMMETGLLGPDLLIGHGQILSGDGDAMSMSKHETTALRDTKTTICHLPWVKARRGGVINSIQKYRDMGFRQCIGTDTYPFDLFNDMRMASVLCKIVENNALAGLSADVFNMATVGGADALGRADLGRLALGCKADIVFVRTDTPKATPIYDPFKFLIHAATGDDVERVIVNGETIVEEGEVLTIDVPEAVRQVNEASTRVWNRLDL